MDKAARRLEAQKWPAGKGAAQYDWEPPRVAQGIPDRATRLKMIGNACPPQQYLVGLAAIRAMAEAMGYD
jgi:DNA (cytosine-5)-methyltransferase 1